LKLYIALGAPDQAIAMYKQADRTDDMMRLMAIYYSGEVTVRFFMIFGCHINFLIDRTKAFS